MAVNDSVERVWRAESARLIAGLARMTHDVGLAEDLAQEALVAALEQWPASGIPDNPGAWLMTIAKRRAVDTFRRADTHQRKVARLGRDLTDRQESFETEVDEAIDDDIGDDLLKLIFTACHPVLSQESRVALTLRLLGGLTTEEIARAYLAPEPTVAQRIVRAKKTLAQKKIPYEVPQGQELPPRLASVLEVVYAIFNEGYSATSGDRWTRPTLCEEAMRLGRLLAGLAPDQPEIHGLVALMEIQASRLAARSDADGRPIVLMAQDRSLWDRTLIDSGLRALERVAQPGPYSLQAEIAACHARARTPQETDWKRIVELYETLAELNPSPVVELNRAVAVGMAYGPQAGLELADALEREGRLADYHLLPTVRGEFLARLGRGKQASEAFTRAAGLTRNATERELLMRRARDAHSQT